MAIISAEVKATTNIAIITKYLAVEEESSAAVQCALDPADVAIPDDVLTKLSKALSDLDDAT